MPQLVLRMDHSYLIRYLEKGETRIRLVSQSVRKIIAASGKTIAEPRWMAYNLNDKSIGDFEAAVQRVIAEEELKGNKRLLLIPHFATYGITFFLINQKNSKALKPAFRASLW